MVVIQRKEYNILLLGQTGAGKSTFINGFWNYIAFNNTDEVFATGEVKYLIPTIFDWYDDDGNHTIIRVGLEDIGERQEIGKSATQHVKSYLFEFGTIGIRLIDTPGFGDTEGIEKDEKICENLLNFLSVRKELQELHGIIFVFKPNDTRMTTFFTYCINQIFSKLHKDACQNIAFVFTNAKGTDYRPGPTLSLLKSVITDIPDVKIKCIKENIFCVENDCIKFLLTYFNNDNLGFDDNTKQRYETPWKCSSQTYIRLIKYIKSLDPHSVKDTIAINAARNYSVKLKTELPKILDKIEEKIEECEQLEKQIRDTKGNISLLQKLLFKKTTIKREGRYHVVCRHDKCKLKETHGKNKEACCVNCKALRLSSCSIFPLFKSKCTVCGCEELDHVFENNEDYAGVRVEKNEDIEENVKAKQAIINKTRLTLFEQRINIKKYQAEKKYIEYWIVKFSRYLKDTVILSDQRYNETDSGTTEDNYSEEDDSSIMAPENIGEILNELSNLQMVGEDIQALLNRQNIIIPEERVICIDQVLDTWKEVLEYAT